MLERGPTLAQCLHRGEQLDARLPGGRDARDADGLSDGLSITSQLQDFRERRQVLALLRALSLTVRQGRTLELLYGVYCHLAHRPSALPGCHDSAPVRCVLDRGPFLRPARLTRDRVVQLYRGRYDVGGLPQDFAYVRCQSIRRYGDGLVLGEYGEGSRIAHVTPRSCTMHDHYRRVPGVRHIHSILPYGGADELLVATGDSAKVLDLWAGGGGGLRFVRRLRRRLAGFTAAARVNEEYYFGSDFSGRPNYLETLDGAKFFFPPLAYHMFVIDLFPVFDRYLVSVSRELRQAGGRKAVSVFDTAKKRFLFCQDIASMSELRALSLKPPFRGAACPVGPPSGGTACDACAVGLPCSCM